MTEEIAGFREAGQKIDNTFRTFADKEEVDYSDKEKKFSKIEAAKKPWQWQKRYMNPWYFVWMQPLTRWRIYQGMWN